MESGTCLCIIYHLRKTRVRYLDRCIMGYCHMDGGHDDKIVDDIILSTKYHFQINLNLTR